MLLINNIKSILFYQ